ncbi:hypothetical protein J437_LFUL018765 [Ladona fulva]|uniref:Peptidase S1 domain-containing protein n=1 Tax=Ladona fulva TaxID=123851 RepID=A0A8K0P9H4_LADFU|nr:hypothetical protein J437_LFUL018765 [Ladona fulva]
MAPTSSTTSALDSKISLLKLANSELLENLQKAMDKMSSYDQWIEAAKLLDGPSRMSSLDSIQEEVKKDCSTVSEEKIDKQYSRHNCLLIHSLPENKDENCLSLGDGGAPLHSFLMNECTYELWRVISFGLVCGDPKKPSVYTKMFAYISWIEDIVWPA